MAIGDVFHGFQVVGTDTHESAVFHPNRGHDRSHSHECRRHLPVDMTAPVRSQVVGHWVAWFVDRHRRTPANRAATESEASAIDWVSSVFK